MEEVLESALVPENNEGFLAKLKKMAASTSSRVLETSPVSPTLV